MKKHTQQTSGVFVHHSHFLGLPVPSGIEEMIFDCRDYMQSAYGCKSGYGTPPHITLIAPFTLPDGLTDRSVYECAFSALGDCRLQGLFPFEVSINGFGCFSERTLFAHVEDSETWQKLHSLFISQFSKEIPGAIKRSDRRFYPHLSVANRDIPAGAMDEALKHFAQLNLSEQFTASEICIYTRTASGDWKEGVRLQ